MPVSWFRHKLPTQLSNSLIMFIKIFWFTIYRWKIPSLEILRTKIPNKYLPFHLRKFHSMFLKVVGPHVIPCHEWCYPHLGLRGLPFIAMQWWSFRATLSQVQCSTTKNSTSFLAIDGDPGEEKYEINTSGVSLWSERKKECLLNELLRAGTVFWQ